MKTSSAHGKIKWLTLANAEDTATLKQHAFIEKVRLTPIIREEYSGNKMLCSRGGCSSDGDSYDHFDLLEDEGFNEAKACKTCIKISKSL